MTHRTSPDRPLREDQIDPAFAHLFERGREAWPSLPLSAASFARHAARHLPEGAAPEGAAPEPSLATLHAADLYLACACHERLPGAATAFLARHEADIEAALRSHRVAPDQRDELRQEIREKLLVGRPGVPPKIGDYAGRGPLGGWVRVASIRTALNFLEQRRSDRLAVGAEVGETAEAPAPDPELAFLKSHYREEVQRALKDALTGLAAEERNVLRLYFLDGLSIDRIAAVYGVHRATAARWVTRGREALLKGTQALLGQRLRAPQAEVDSIVGMVRSQLDLTLSSLFRRPDP